MDPATAGCSYTRHARRKILGQREILPSKRNEHLGSAEIYLI